MKEESMLCVPEHTRICLFNDDAVVLNLMKDEFFVVEHGADLFRSSPQHLQALSVLNEALSVRAVPDLQADNENGYFEIRWMMPDFPRQRLNALIRLAFFLKMKRLLRKVDCNGLAGMTRELSLLRKQKDLKDVIPPEKVTHKLNNLISRVMQYNKDNNPCLVYSFMMTYSLIERGYDASLIVGVRTEPFYSHAWVEVGGNVAGDDPFLRNKLSVILEV